jgi:hypothetical protein
LSGNENLGNGAIPNINTGNTRLANGLPAYHYNPIIADAWVGYNLDKMAGYNGTFPIRVGLTVMHNPAAPDRNDAFDAGITFGKSGKKGTWDVSYRYKYLEADANFEEFPDNDFGAFYGAAPGGAATVSGKSAGYNGGTGLRGHVIKVSYSPYDPLLLTVTYALTDLIHDTHVDGKGIDSGTGRLFVDATWRF